jgi:hypothetical protein
VGFLAPALLGLGLLAGVPILVHLLRRRVGRTVDFPAVRYLARMEQEHSKQMKLRHRLLLLLRVLAVLALAIAAARPIAALAGLGHAPVALAIVVDNSMSSGAVSEGRAVLDGLRADAKRLVGTLTPDDRAWVVTADGRVTGGGSAALLLALDEVKALGGRGDLGAAVRRAVALARSGAPRAPVVGLLSDGQPNAFVSADDSAVVVGDVPLVAMVRSRGAIRNRGVVAARAEPARWTPTGSVAFAIASPDSTPWRVTLDGRTVARGTSPAGTVRDPARVAQRLGSSVSGWVRGSVELDADELRGDDARWFAVRVAPPPLVATRAESGPFLGTALATLVEEKRLSRGPEGSPGTVTVAGADAAGVRGPVLLVAPSDPVRVGEANRTLARLGIPWRFGAIARDLVLTRAMHGHDARATTDSVATADSRGVTALDEVPVRLRYPLVRSPGNGTSATTDTLAMAGGAPWAVAGPDYVLVASPLEPDATDLPVRAGFVPWLLDALSRRLGADGRLVEAHPGERLAGFEGISALERPDGSTVPLSSDRLTVPNEAGVYYLRRQAARVGALVVNPEPEESALGQGGDAGKAMLSHVTGRSVTAETDGERWQRRVLESALGRSLLPPLVALALAALLLESWFSRERNAAGTAGARLWRRRNGAAASSRAA